MERTPPVVKEELIDFEDCDVKNIFDDNFNISLKVECEDVVVEGNDWCIQNVINDEDSYRNSIINFEDLTQCCVQRCLQCYMIFTNCYQLLRHNVTHLTVNIQKVAYFQCSECNDIFLLRFKLQQHIKTKHECGKEKLKGKKKFIKVSKSNHKCGICQKILSYKSWHSHLREVHCERKFKCNLCGYRFKAARYLKRHMKIHEGICVKKYERKVCSLCNSEYNNNELLSKHMKNCHSNISYDCGLCPYVNTFKSLPYLRSHLRRQHKTTGYKFLCKICKKAFKWIQLLNIHIEECH